LKPKARLFADPLLCRSGELVLKEGFVPIINREVLTAHEIGSERFATTSVVMGAR
jgi:hypothetical protein